MLANVRGAASSQVIILPFICYPHGICAIANSAQDLRVVRHQPWRRPLAIASAVVIALACLLVGYRLGLQGAVAGNVDRVSLAGNLQAAEDELATVKANLVDSRLANDVAKQAISQLRQEMQAKHEETERLEEQVTFYKSLMSPGELQEGLKINELELSRAGEGYRFELLLTQVAVRRSFISGDVRLDFIGTSEEGQVVKSLTELAPEAGYPLKFRFRYFQDLKGEFVLRDDFRPERIMVTASQRGKEPLQVSFPWPKWAGEALAGAE